MTHVMKIEEFKDLLDTYGSNFSRWPASSIKPAEICIENHEEARNLYAEMAQLDDLFTNKAPSSETASKLTEEILKKSQSK